MQETRKVIATKVGLKCVTWLYRDVAHYGFEDEDGHMLEMFTPSKDRKGNALRSYVLKLFAKKEAWQFLGRWPTVALDVDEILPGHVFVYEPAKAQVTFALITEVTPSLITAVTNKGGQALWLADRINRKLIARELQVIAYETVPEEYRTFPKQS